jgi:outer membrane protein assembly factor BamB
MRVLKMLAVVLSVPLTVFAVLYLFFDLRLELTGGGRPQLVFRTDLEEQAEIVRRHRAAQQLEAPPPSARVDNGPAPTPAPTAADSSSATGIAAADGAPGTAAETAPAVRPYWTDFRGPRRDGHYRERRLAREWPAGGLEPLWKQPAGAGYASFVSAHGRAFTIEQRGREEAVAAYDVGTGRELWTHAWPALFRESMGGDGPRATPTWSDGVVYALGATGELRALADATGGLIWRVNILEDTGAENLPWGMAGAPLVTPAAVIVAPGGRNGSVAAYDRRTGKRLWASEN